MRQLKQLALDLALIALATLAAVWLRDNLVISAAQIEKVLPYLAGTLASALIILPALGINRTMWRFSAAADYKRLLMGCVAIVSIAVMIGFAVDRNEDIARSLPIMQVILMACLLGGVRVLMRAHRHRNSDSAPVQSLPPSPQQETVLVVGLSGVTELFIESVREAPNCKITIAGVLGRADRHTGHLVRGQPILGTTEELPQVLNTLQVHGVEVDRIVVAVGFDKLSEAARKGIQDIENGTPIKVDYFAERLGFTDNVTPLHPARRGDRRSPPDVERRARLDLADNPYWRTKRWMDATLAAIALVALVPVMLVIGIVNAAVHGFPIIFWQQRPGRHGVPFRVYKFRSLLGAHDQDGRRLADEQRQTWFGQFLRASRADELPQLWNILRGDMSFIGPRPLLKDDQLEQFSDRLLVRPGLTGWAQVNGGKSISASDKMALDIWYIHNASLALDVKIALKTVAMVIFGERENEAAVQRAWTDIEMARKVLPLHPQAKRSAG